MGTSGIIVSQYEGLCRDVRAGDKILLADGLIELKVTSSAVVDTACRLIMVGYYPTTRVSIYRVSLCQPHL